MKRRPACLLIIFNLAILCASCEQKPREIANQSGILVEGVPSKEIVLVGDKKQVEEGHKSMNELIDPAYDIALKARKLFRDGKYDESEKEALRAIETARDHTVVFSAHQTLLRVYEAKNNPKAAINQIDWLLNNVNEDTKSELLQKRAKFQEMLSNK